MRLAALLTLALLAAPAVASSPIILFVDPNGLIVQSILAHRCEYRPGRRVVLTWDAACVLTTWTVPPFCTVLIF